MIYEYDFTWFPRALNPNERVHYKEKNNHFQAYKEECRYVAHRATPKPSDDLYAISIVFYPPCGRKRDLDNCYAAMKAGLDGLALAIGIDDSQFRPVTLDFGEKEKVGRVNIRIKKHEKS